ncbi:hypothetical protein MTR_6g092870 [Medicago truncatula]|uniref:Uncharacterized protein n=1 Tax=Medicago truncatula TaxID=3880 RepID=A0A072UCT2_MEDTR|nr:hypothetical protein MTR_6g092870 [Medicago truncatula]
MIRQKVNLVKRLASNVQDVGDRQFPVEEVRSSPTKRAVAAPGSVIITVVCDVVVRLTSGRNTADVGGGSSADNNVVRI